MTLSERLVHEADGLVYACPECDVAGDITIRRRGNTHAGNPEDPLACGKCGTTFEEPVEREDKRGGRQAKYADLSPEDLGLGAVD